MLGSCARCGLDGIPVFIHDRCETAYCERDIDNHVCVPTRSNKVASLPDPRLALDLDAPTGSISAEDDIAMPTYESGSADRHRWAMWVIIAFLLLGVATNTAVSIQRTSIIEDYQIHKQIEASNQTQLRLELTKLQVQVAQLTEEQRQTHSLLLQMAVHLKVKLNGVSNIEITP